MSAHRKIGRNSVIAAVCLFGALAGSMVLWAQPPNNLITTFAGTGYAGYSGEGLARYAALNHPEAMVFDAAGNLYVSESGDNRVRKIDVSGNITTVAGGNGPGFSGDTGAATLAQLNYPIGLALDGSNNLYIVDRSNARVRKVNLGTGQITTVAGNGTQGYNGDNILAVNAELNQAHSIACDSAGNLYIGDQSNNRVRMVSTSGMITTVAGTGTATSTGDNAAATAATINGPLGVALDSSGTKLFVAENGGNRVREFTIGGNITTVAGTGSAAFFGDGSAANLAKLSGPVALSLDSSGNLYIGDTGNQRIRIVANALTSLGAGVINTLAGNGTAGYLGDGGSPTLAELSNPLQAVVGPGPNSTQALYITDWANHRIRETIATPTNNATPTLNYIYPSSIVAGAGSFTLSVYGSGFVAGASVLWNGNPKVTTFVSSTILTATILNTDVSSATTQPVTVSNPGVAASSPQTFTVLASVPTSPNTNIMTFAGNGFNNFDGDGGPALYASFGSMVQSTFDINGNMYVADCSNNRVRMINPSGVVTTIAGGGSGIAGNQQEGIPATAAQLYCPNGVAVDSTATNLYIGEYNGYRVRKVVLASGTISTYAGPTPAAGNNPGFGGDGGAALQASFSHISSLTIDPAGNLYVVDRGNIRIRKITPNGAMITTIAGNGIQGFFGGGGPAIQTPLYDPYQIARDSLGNLYIAEAGGDQIWKVDTSGYATVFAGNFSGGFTGDGGLATNAEVNSPEGIIVDANGNVYFADANNERVRMVSGGVIVTVAGNGSNSFGGDGGPATAAQMSNALYGLSIDAQGRVYISDVSNYRIRRLEPITSSNPVPTITSLSPAGIQAGSGQFTLTVYGTNFVPGATVQWTPNAGSPSNRATTFFSSTILFATINAFDVQTAGTGTVTVVNPPSGGGSSNGKTFTIFNPPAAPNSLIITFAGNGIVGHTGDGGPAIDATFNNLQKIIFDSQGNLYVAEYRNHVVRKITPAGIVSTIAGTAGSAGYSGDTGQAMFAQLNGPTGVALDGSGNLYISEYDGNRIRMVANAVTAGGTGTITTIAGNTSGSVGTSGSSGDGSAAVNALLCHPYGIIADSPGNLYIADVCNHKVRKISAGIITTVAGTGAAGYFGDGGPATDSPLNSPNDVALDATGTILYIADTSNHRIRKVDGTGNITTVAGNGNGAYCCDGGPATSAQLYYPTGITVDSAGNLYIGDTDDYRVRKVNTLGIITTIAGNGTQGYSGDGGLATSAELTAPYFVALDPNGNVYVSDNSETRIRELVPPGSSASPATLTNMTPSSAEVGSGNFTLTVTGSNFVTGAYVQWNNVQLTTTFISGSKLQATVPSFDLTSLGTASVSVFTPGGGGASNSLTFNIIAVPTPSTALIITAVANGIAAYSGDTGPALFATINNPQGLAYDQAGNLYIADCSNNVVRKVTTGGTITTYAGTGTAGYNSDGIPAASAQLHCPVGLAFDGNNNLYIADQGNNRVRQVNPAGFISTVAGNGTRSFSGDNNPATSATLGVIQGVAVDSSNNVYIADQSNQRIRKVVIGGNITTFAGTGTAGYFGDGGPAVTSTLYNPCGLAVDSANNVYIDDQYNHRIRMVNAAGNISTVAGNGSQSSGGNGGPATSAGLNYPIGIYIDSNDNLYIADQDNHQIRKVCVSPAASPACTASGIIFTVAGNGTQGFSGDGGLAINAELNYPSYVTLDPNGNLLISDNNNNRIRKLVQPATTTLTPTLNFLNPARAQVSGGTFTLVVYGSNFSPGALVQWNGVSSAITTTYVSANELVASVPSFELGSTGTFPITVLNPGTGGVSGSLTFTVYTAPSASTALISTFAGTGYQGYSGDGGPALFASLNVPQGLIRDGNLNFYFADNNNNRVRKISSTGVITTIAGGNGAGYSGDNGPALQAQLNNPCALALDTFGNLYIADCNNNVVRKITGFLTGGTTITTVAGTGTVGYNGDNIAATTAQLHGPQGITVDSTGNLYIADRSNNRVRMVNTSGTISTYAGTGTAGYFGDGGPATTTPINQPIGLAIDLVGNLYIAEFGGERVRKIGPDGTVYTVAGTGSNSYSGDGGPATSAAFSGPLGLFIDAGNNLYISDYSNQRVREVTGGVVTTIAGNGTAGFSGDGGLATSAMLSSPEFIFVDTGGNVYFTEIGSQHIRRVGPPTSNNPTPTSNPALAITSLQPSSAQVGGTSFTLVVNGTGFVPGSTVQWNTFPRSTTYVSPNQLQVLINNFDIALIGTQSVTVTSPTTGGGGGTTTAASFLVFPTPVASTAMINTFSGSGTQGTLDGTASTAKFNNLQLLTFDAQGNLYAAECGNNRVVEITANGSAYTVAGGGSVLGDNGPATSATLSCPVGVAFDGLGNLYIAEQNGNRIRRVAGGTVTGGTVNPGTITTIAGNGVAGYAGDNGPAANSQVNEPNGLALDSHGNLYVAEYRNYRIREIAITNGVVGNITTVAGNGIGGFYAGDGGPALESPLVGPTGVAVDALGDIYIADYDGNRIRMVDTSGIIHLVAGTGSASYSGDGGPALAAAIRQPYQLTLDTAGNIYFADRVNQRVRKIDPTGVITTVAGNGSQSYSGDGGLAANAALNTPNGVALDAAGDLYIADSGNNRIREVGAVAGVTCLYSINPSSNNFGAAATTGSFNVTTSAGCLWSVHSNVPWLTVTTPSTGASSGSGPVNFSVAQNTNAAPQTGTITAAGLTYTAIQSGTGCSFQLSGSTSITAAGGPGNTVTVTSPTGCPWTAVSNSPFIHITAGASGTGSGTVTYSVDTNNSASTLQGSLTIGGQIFQITQAGTTCTYSLLTTSANYTSSAATGNVGVVALTGCTWTAGSNQSWLTITAGTSGSGNGFVAYSVAANAGSVARTANITVSGTTGLIFTVNQQGFVSPVGTVTASAATGAPGGTANVPIILNLPTGQLDSISFGATVTPVNPAPAITTGLAFSADPSMPTPTITDTGVVGSISVSFLSLATPISGTQTLGTVQISIPGTAQIGQSYTVTITGVTASSAGIPVSLGAGTNATVLLSNNYLVGDVYPYTGNSAGQFGIGNLSTYGTLDLIYALRQSVNTPGFTIPTCTDRFDAMDSFPVDTGTRGGNGVIDNLDLIETLRRTTNIDTSRPTRGTRGLCGADPAATDPASADTSTVKRPDGPTAGWLEMGSARDGRVPVYLSNEGTLALVGLSLSVDARGLKEQPKLTFVPAQGFNPTLTDSGVEGMLAIAWLEGLYAPPGRILLGYIEGAHGAPIKFGAAVANARDGSTPRIDFREAR